MAKRRWGIACLVVVSCLCLCACAAATAVMPVSTDHTDVRILPDARVQYRNASLIVAGACVQNHVNAEGANCFDLLISDILAGDAATGDIIHCTEGNMDIGREYLLYLGQNPVDVDYAEDTAGFVLLSGAPLPIVDSEVIWEGSRVSLGTLRDDIERMSRVISAPAPLYYFDTLKPLADGAEEIFIGRVVDLPEKSEKTFSIRNDGAAERTQMPASIATVEAFGAVKGVLRYGERIKLVHCPARMGDMTDAATLQPKGFYESQAAQLKKGGYYLFFLQKGPDDKQTYYFPVNPLQGYVELAGETLALPAANRPLAAYQELTPLVKALQTVLRQEPLKTTAPALSVD